MNSTFSVVRGWKEVRTDEELTPQNTNCDDYKVIHIGLRPI